jgi:hypothetical protein
MRPDPPFCTENYFPTLKMSEKPIGRGYLLRLNKGRATPMTALALRATSIPAGGNYQRARSGNLVQLFDEKLKG